jgi:pimeloyl-ACP methyl ester carboxylesterase
MAQSLLKSAAFGAHFGRLEMALRNLFGVLSAAVSAATLVAYGRYRKEMRDVRDAVDSGSTIAETTAGPIEYAEKGDGARLLLIHGAGGGYDQGLLIGRGFDEEYRIIAPSRFGYLKTPVPTDSSPAAQADAHAALLDFLGIDACIAMGVSAGAPSAIELALRHPNRVRALILLVPRTYDPTNSIGVDESMQSQMVLRLIEASADFLFWLAMRVARSSVVRFLGVPPELEASASKEDRELVSEVMRSVLPLSARVRGIDVDSSIQLAPWPPDRITVPTLIVSAKDDLFETLAGARFTAERIQDAELRVLDSGGHLMVGQSQQVKKWIGEFLERRLAPAVRRRTSTRKLAARTRDLVTA